MKTAFNQSSIPNANRLAKLLHPDKQNMVIAEVIPESTQMTTYILKADDGHELACFEAGSYIPVYVEIEGNMVERPYALCSSPKQSTQGFYAITVKAVDGGYVSNYIHQNWTVGTKVLVGSPVAAENYNPLRDAKNVVALAGGVGVTPFLSLAQAIADGDVDCNLTLIYGVNTEEEIIYTKKWVALETQTRGKVRFIPVVAHDTDGRYETGFITLDIVKKYCDVYNSSFFISGPPAMIKAVTGFLTPLGIAKKYIRISMSGTGVLNVDAEQPCQFQLMVHMAGETYLLKANSNETILSALERGGLKPAVRCRSGRCGFCRAMVVKGEFRLADSEDYVRKADKQLGFIHPCCSYPTSDMELVVQRIK